MTHFANMLMHDTTTKEEVERQLKKKVPTLTLNERYYSSWNDNESMNERLNVMKYCLKLYHSTILQESIRSPLPETSSSSGEHPLPLNFDLMYINNSEKINFESVVIGQGPKFICFKCKPSKVPPGYESFRCPERAGAQFQKGGLDSLRTFYRHDIQQIKCVKLAPSKRPGSNVFTHEIISFTYLGKQIQIVNFVSSPNFKQVNAVSLSNGGQGTRFLTCGPKENEICDHRIIVASLDEKKEEMKNFNSLMNDGLCIQSLNHTIIQDGGSNHLILSDTKLFGLGCEVSSERKQSIFLYEFNKIDSVSPSPNKKKDDIVPTIQLWEDKLRDWMEHLDTSSPTILPHFVLHLKLRPFLQRLDLDSNLFNTTIRHMYSIEKKNMTDTLHLSCEEWKVFLHVYTHLVSTPSKLQKYVFDLNYQSKNEVWMNSDMKRALKDCSNSLSTRLLLDALPMKYWSTSNYKRIFCMMIDVYNIKVSNMTGNDDMQVNDRREVAITVDEYKTSFDRNAKRGREVLLCIDYRNYISDGMKQLIQENKMSEYLKAMPSKSIIDLSDDFEWDTYKSCTVDPRLPKQFLNMGGFEYDIVPGGSSNATKSIFITNQNDATEKFLILILNYEKKGTERSAFSIKNWMNGEHKLADDNSIKITKEYSSSNDFEEYERRKDAKRDEDMLLEYIKNKEWLEFDHHPYNYYKTQFESLRHKSLVRYICWKYLTYYVGADDRKGVFKNKKGERPESVLNEEDDVYVRNHSLNDSFPIDLGTRSFKSSEPIFDDKEIDMYDIDYENITMLARIKDKKTISFLFARKESRTEDMNAIVFPLQKDLVWESEEELELDIEDDEGMGEPDDLFETLFSQ